PDTPLGLIHNRVHQWLWATKDWASAHADLVEKIQLALMETDVWLHDPANLDTAINLIIDNKLITNFPGQSDEQVRKFLSVALPLLVSYVPPADVEAFQKAYVKVGVLEKSPPPVSDFMLPSVPKSPAEVASRVK
ncbi:MAG: hypothetical protein ACRDQ7_10150, partial [Haloechinothrix sp.]